MPSFSRGWPMRWAMSSRPCLSSRAWNASRWSLGHLQHGAQLLVEQRAQGGFGPAVELDLQAAVAGEGHLQQRDDDATVGAVVVGQQQALGIGFLHQGEQALQALGIVQVRRHAAAAVEGLGQRRGAEAIAAAAQIDQPQVRLAPVQAQLRGQRLAHVGDPGEAGHHQRDRRHGALLAGLRVLPNGLHGHRILAHRHRDAQLGTQLLGHGMHGIEQRRVLALVVDRGHPVGGQADMAQLADRRGGQVGDGLAHRDARGVGAGQQRHRGALGHGHGLAGIAVEIQQGHRAVGHRHLPRADHRVARAQPTDAAIADGDQERLAADHRQAQHATQRLAQLDAGQVRHQVHARLATLGVAVHARRLAEQHVHRQVDHVDVATGCRARAGARPRWPRRPPPSGSARARRSPRGCPCRPGARPARSVPATRCTTPASASARGRRRESRPDRCRRPGRHRGGSRESRWTARRRRHRGC